MAVKLQESYQDSLEYVKNITALGGCVDMAEYQARYINHSIEVVIDRVVEKLNPAQFATKLDVQELRIEMKAMEHRLLKWQIGISIATISSMIAMFKFFIGHQ